MGDGSKCSVIKGVGGSLSICAGLRTTHRVRSCMQMMMWHCSPGLVSFDELMGLHLQVGPVLHEGNGSKLLRGDTRSSLRILDVAMRVNQIRAGLHGWASPSRPVYCSFGEAFSVAALRRMDVPFGTFIAFGRCSLGLVKLGSAAFAAAYVMVFSGH